VPIFPTPYWEDHVLNQKSLLKEWPIETTHPASGSIATMAEVIRRHSGELTLFTIGPLTNIAGLVRYFPEEARQVEEIIVMGGRLVEENPTSPLDPNIMLDAVAAHVVFSFSWNKLTVLSAATPGSRGFLREELERHLREPRHAPVLRACETWWTARGTDKTGTCDPMAVAIPFQRGLYTFEGKGAALTLTDLDLQGQKAPEGTVLGYLRPSDAAHATRANVVSSIDFDRFAEHYFRIIGNPAVS
jgi:inosine-uridine nucleoside N-ribohydrolase